mgnify:FL=1|jgi:hypothetical protein|tara:strand:- start:1803 stop:2060 length:258 start_codon:yes stop_codon:yes gene_type:complete
MSIIFYKKATSSKNNNNYIMDDNSKYKYKDLIEFINKFKKFKLQKNLIINIVENNFNISLETDDIIDFGSFKKGREILRRYDVET